MFLGKTLDSHSAYFHPGVQFGTNKFNPGSTPEQSPAMDCYPLQWGAVGGGGGDGGVEILVVASCYRNRRYASTRPDGQDGLYTVLTLNSFTGLFSV